MLSISSQTNLSYIDELKDSLEKLNLKGVGFISDPEMRNVQVLRATQGSAGVFQDRAPSAGPSVAFT